MFTQLTVSVNTKTIKADNYEHLTKNTGSENGEKSIDVTSTDTSARQCYNNYNKEDTDGRLCLSSTDSFHTSYIL